ncbi:MAG: aldose 1-epimerase family protein [Lachnospiraceae bacterium]|nr:aldose 1-epimerase family protein [Lachnospiraceae bacterium]
MDIIENDFLIASFRRNGAELASLKSKKNGKEYIFPGIPQFWSKSSPVLFPIVGCLKNGRFKHKGKEYGMNIHGFANYQDFEISNHTEASIAFILESKGKFSDIYPFEFELTIRYRLEENELIVGYEVVNLSDERMYFSIGGHTAFVCPIIETDKRNEYFLKFHGIDYLDCSRIDMSCGLLYEEHERIELQKADTNDKGGILRIDDNLFDKDTLIGENYQTHEISLLSPDKAPYLSVCFEAPVFGIWSPKGKAAPFICIEPWYGRCDKKSFDGSLSEREWGNALDIKETFYKEFSIKIFT